jgi:hypothetical protein
MRPHHAAVLATLAVLVCSAVPAAEPKKTTPPAAVAIQFHNGTLIKDATIEGTVEIMTRYGKFVIPSEDIRRVEFGFRLVDEDRRILDQALQQLMKDNYEQRETATRSLQGLGRAAYPALLKAVKSETFDLDAKHRIDNVMQEIRKVTPSDQLKFPEEDMVHTPDAILKGKITTDTLKARAGVLGDLQLPLAKLRAVRASVGYRMVRIEPGGTEPWVETDIEIPGGARVNMKVTGTIQFDVAGRKISTGPQGSAELQRVVNDKVPHDVRSPVGTLHGRLSRDGKHSDFSIGEHLNTVSADGGRLSLRIYVGGPHDFPMVGSYQVEIELE